MCYTCVLPDKCEKCQGETEEQHHFRNIHGYVDEEGRFWSRYQLVKKDASRGQRMEGWYEDVFQNEYQGVEEESEEDMESYLMSDDVRYPITYLEEYIAYDPRDYFTPFPELK